MAGMNNGMPPRNPFSGMSFNKAAGNTFGNPMDATSEAAGNSNAGGWIALGSALGTGIGDMLPSSYNQNIGMARPNFIKEMMNAQYTGMGASIAGPWGALIGGIIDTGKNIGSYVDKQAKYRAAVTGWQNREAQQQRMDTMLPDMTGYARKGMRTPYCGHGGMVPVEIERNEAVVMPTNDGYDLMGVTPPNAPTHEQGGIKTMLPQGALVFPQQYIPGVLSATSNGDNNTMDMLRDDMLAGAKQAALNGEPYSSGGLFADGGEVLAQSIRGYDVSNDSDKKQARKLMDDVAGSDLDQDTKDMLLMGLISRVDPSDKISKRMQDLHPKHYGYFTGAADKLPTSQDESRMGAMDMMDYNALAMNKATENSIVGANNNQQSTTPSNSGVMAEQRTATRHAAMKAGLYADDSGTPLTMWDDKTGKRVFNDYAKTKYGYTGDVSSVTSKPTFAQDLGKTKSSQASKTTSSKPASSYVESAMKQITGDTSQASKIDSTANDSMMANIPDVGYDNRAVGSFYDDEAVRGDNNMDSLSRTTNVRPNYGSTPYMRNSSKPYDPAKSGMPVYTGSEDTYFPQQEKGNEKILSSLTDLRDKYYSVQQQLKQENEKYRQYTDTYHRDKEVEKYVNEQKKIVESRIQQLSDHSRKLQGEITRIASQITQ